MHRDTQKVVCWSARLAVGGVKKQTQKQHVNAKKKKYFFILLLFSFGNKKNS